MTDAATTKRKPISFKALALPAFLLGFSFSGFFDGILLHQILQWHHLLSALEGRSVQFQILMDGYFHLLMYVIGGAGLWLLWKRRSGFALGGSSERFLGLFLLGFGAWHAADAVLSHWVLGIHRIKWDAENLLAWDLGWLALFGLGPAALGWLLLRRVPTHRSNPAATLAVAAALIGGAGIWSMLPPEGPAFTTIVFAPSVPHPKALALALEAGGDLVWMDGQGTFVVSATSPGSALPLYTKGALLVSGSGGAPGCFSWTR
jgi:uncharacterized membrane protein